MCGIAGIVAAPDAPIDVARIVAAESRLVHRGPDDVGFLGWDCADRPRASRESDVCRGARVALIHRRLSILDLTRAGWQPMSSPDGRHHLVFNGEIYNFRELRAELEATGRRFRSSGDSEVLLAAWSRWGTQALRRLVGMFAFAVLDTVERRLVLVRDFFGIKPLYYAERNGGFAFASEIKALLELDGSAARPEPQRLYDYLRFGLTDHAEQTMFAGVRQLPPAHYLELDLETRRAAEPRRYWQIDLDRRCDLPFDAACRRLQELFVDSVRLHLRSDVPVGAALSGGIDSSAIVSSMRRVSGPQLDLHAVSYIADDPAISEERWIELVARETGAALHRSRPAPEELVHDLETLIDVQDEPFGSTSIYAQHRVFRLAREAGIKVMLDGQGADELLGGYRPYLAARLGSLLRRGRWIDALRLGRAARELPGFRGKELLYGLGALFVPQAVERRVRRALGRELVPPWLDIAWFAARGVDPRMPIPRARSRDALRETLHRTLTCSSLPMLLRYEDRNSMAFSIESRVPFLTPALAEFVLSLPESYILADDATSKAVFRGAMRGIVPDAILERRDKIGFATPERQWLGDLRDWVERMLGSETAASLPFLQIEAVRREWAGILTGERPFDWRVWRWINTIGWVERFSMTWEP